MPYVYKLTDLETRKWYIGCRTAKGCIPGELGISYFTSSKIVKPLYRNNIGRFLSEILVVSDDYLYVNKVEADILRFRGAMSDPLSYNMHNGDGNFNPAKSGVISGNKRAESGELQKMAGAAGKLGGKIGGKISGKMNVENGHLARLRTKEHQSYAGSIAGKKTGPVLCEKINKLKYKCLECGKITTKGPMANHQSFKNHKGLEAE